MYIYIYIFIYLFIYLHCVYIYGSVCIYIPPGGAVSTPPVNRYVNKGMEKNAFRVQNGMKTRV